MPRLLRRLSIAFAVLALGLVISGWIAVRVIATNVIEKQAEPVHHQLVADWAAHADALEKDLVTAAPWGVTTAPTPTSLGCELRWVNPPAAHVARCKEHGAALPPEVLEQLEKLGDDVLGKANEAPTVERDLSWMTELRGHDDWNLAAGTPQEFVDVDPAKSASMDFPVIEGRHLDALSTLRLLQGVRSNALEEAVTDVLALHRAVLNRPALVDQLTGLTGLQHVRLQLAALDRTALAPNEDELRALLASRLAAALLWHPWVPKAQRTRFLALLAPASRCAATAEVLTLLELGTPLSESYGDFTADLFAWQPGTCGSDFVERAFTARKTMSPDAWEHAMRAANEDPGGISPSVAITVGRSSQLVRKAMLETLITLLVVRPFQK
jgi:hypothetical protein